MISNRKPSHLKRGEGRGKDTAIPIVLSMKGDGRKGGCRQWTSRGPRSRGAISTFLHDDQNAEARENETSDSEQHRVRQTADSLVLSQQSATRQAQAPQDGTIGLFFDSYKKGRCSKDKTCDNWHPPFCVFHKRGQGRAGVTCPFVHLKHQKGERKGLKRDCKTSQKQVRNFLQEPIMDMQLSTQREFLSAKGQKEPKHKFQWSDYDMKVAYFLEANPGRDVMQKNIWHETSMGEAKIGLSAKKKWHARGNFTRRLTRSKEITKTCTVRTS